MKRHHLLMLLLLIIALTGCGTMTTPTQPPPLEKVVLGVGYVPDVQFAPLYVAQEKGFYEEAGLEVEIEYGFEHDFVALVAQGKREFTIASGDQVILARAQGLPVTYVMQWYERYPVALVAPAAQGISEPADVNGHSVGLPLFGTSLIGWKALVYATDIDEELVTVKDIGFTQVAAIDQRVVDAAIAYIANEPNQLRDQGIEVNLIEVSDYINLVSNGLVIGEKLKTEKPDLVRRMVQATLKGVLYAADHPQEAFEISRRVIPEITDEEAILQQKVLEDSIKLWDTTAQPGQTTTEAWQESADFLLKTGLIEEPVAVEDLFTNQFAE